MKEITITSTFTLYSSKTELPKDVLHLMEQAEAARANSYSPYSRFKVGAALLLDNGEIVKGSNQENASYPAGLCAERTAVFYAGANYPDARMVKLFITVKSSDYTVDRPAAPCGVCRQVLAEYEVKQETPLEIYLMGETGQVLKADRIRDLLPFVFDKNYLKNL